MSERQLLERTCDGCSKTVLLNARELNQETIAELEQWLIVGRVKYDGHGNFLPDASHYCSENCVLTTLAKVN